MSKGRIVIISGPSGSGKTTLHKMLLDSPRLKNRLIKSISATTRPPRSGEENGKDYLFITTKMFQYKIRANHFLEWQKVFDNYYGTPKKAAVEILRLGQNILLCIDVKGARIVRKAFPNAVTIFIKTPSLKVLRDRLENRDQDSAESKALRLKVAQEELNEEGSYQFVIINDHLETAYRQLENIVVEELGIR